MTMQTNLPRFRRYIQDMTQLVSQYGDDEPTVLARGEVLLKALIDHDDWLPVAFTVPSTEGYRQYLLYCDPLERFSVVSFVWGPGQNTPIHDHQVWGLIGVLRGAEQCEEYTQSNSTLTACGSHRINPGEIDKVSPTLGDIHVVSNAYTDRASISIHVYGGNIGAVRRHVFDPVTGAPRTFISGYHNSVMPNLWDRSKETP